MSDPIHEATVTAVSKALDAACEGHGVLPPRDIAARFWAETVLRESLNRGALPTPETLSAMLEGVPALFISDRNK